MMPAAPDYLIWLDFETTGIDHATLEPLELGMIPTTATWPFEQAGPWLAETILPNAVQNGLAMDVWIDGAGMDPFVIEMHTKSHLFDDVRHRGRSRDELDQLAAGWLDNFDGVKLMAGSGVGRFDKRILERYFPLTFGRFELYGELDVSSWRAGLNLLGLPAGPAQQDAEHRAIPDCKQRLADWRRYARLLRPPAGDELMQLAGGLAEDLAARQGGEIEDYHFGDGRALADTVVKFHDWRWNQP